MANPRTVARVAARIQERAAYCLQFELRDPRASFVTITRVELSPDLKHARIHYSTLETGGARSRVQHMLEDATGFIRSRLGRVLETREIPTLRWIFDESLERAAEIDRLIREARARDAAIRGEAPPEEGEELAAAEEGSPSPDSSDEEWPDDDWSAEEDQDDQP
jgi:ribosome-binding factor A